MPLRIGPYALPSLYLLAPIAGVSEKPFRRRALLLGAGLAPTELISAEGLSRKAKRTLDYLAYDPEVERPFCPQLVGHSPARMAHAARIAKERGAGIIDLNMGCPVPKVTKPGAGAALMRTPEIAAAIVQAIIDATGLPVTAKIRAGWDATSINAVPFAKCLEEAGASAIAVHARTRSQGYAGTADWSIIAAVKRAVSVPVIGNGDVRSPADAARMLAETGCDGVMVGRAAMGNPWVFRELAGGPPASLEERLSTVREHLLEHVAMLGPGRERAAVASFRTMLGYYIHGMRGSSAFRREAMQLETAAEVMAALEQHSVNWSVAVP